MTAGAGIYILVYFSIYIYREENQSKLFFENK